LLADGHPSIEVDDDPIYVRDGKYWTSAGVTAGIDLSLALVADDLGDDVAGEIARWLVMFVRRPGGQSQFSAHLAASAASHPPIRAVQDWLPAHLAEDLSVPVLARRAGMSPRHFARRFRDETGQTPAAHVETLRVEAAKRLLSADGAALAEVARACGFGTVETLHRVFRRATGTTPDRYRQHFAARARA
jgi:transcriptional regulator GlxA family with amidase domain